MKVVGLFLFASMVLLLLLVIPGFEILKAVTAGGYAKSMVDNKRNFMAEIIYLLYVPIPVLFLLLCCDNIGFITSITDFGFDVKSSNQYKIRYPVSFLLSALY